MVKRARQLDIKIQLNVGWNMVLLNGNWWKLDEKKIIYSSILQSQVATYPRNHPWQTWISVGILRHQTWVWTGHGFWSHFHPCCKRLTRERRGPCPYILEELQSLSLRTAESQPKQWRCLKQPPKHGRTRHVLVFSVKISQPNWTIASVPIRGKRVLCQHKSNTSILYGCSSLSMPILRDHPAWCPHAWWPRTKWANTNHGCEVGTNWVDWKETI